MPPYPPPSSSLSLRSAPCSSHSICERQNYVARLVDEVKSISEQCSALLGQLKQAEDTLQNLVDTRGQLEKDIVHKRKNLHLDRDRIQVVSGKEAFVSNLLPA